MYKAAIIGCGRIGTFFDSSGSQRILTHANAYFKHPQISLKGVMDINLEKAIMAGKRWYCNSYKSIEQLFKKDNPDIISLCVPDDYHYEYLNRLIAFHPAAVISEKPLTKNIDESKEIVSKYKKAGIPLFVNYLRRYDKTVQKVKKMIDEGKLGKILHASVKYTKGILHNGTHGIDIANYLFGKLLSLKTLSAVYDYDDKDPTLNAFLCYTKCSNFFLMAGDARYYSIFEFDIVGEKMRIYFDQSGFKYIKYKVEDSLVFPGERVLMKGPRRLTGLNTAIFNLIGNVINYLEGKEEIICGGEDAIRTQKVCNQLVEDHFQRMKDV